MKQIYINWCIQTLILFIIRHFWEWQNAEPTYLDLYKTSLFWIVLQDLTGKLGYSRKKPNIGHWRHGIFHFFTLPLEIPDKTKLHPWKSHKIVLDPLEISRLKSKTPGKFTLFYLGYPIPHPQPPPVCFFSGIAHFWIRSPPNYESWIHPW